MKKQFATYEISLALKELGFDERCLGHFDIQSKVLYVGDTEMNVSVLSEILLPAPLWQQVIDYFREKHQIIIAIHAYHDLDDMDEVDQILWDFALWDKDWNDTSDYTYYHSYEEAREAAILEAIKIVKGEPK